MNNLNAWLHYKKLQPLNEDDAAFVADVEFILSENARLREALESLLDRPHEQHCDWLDPGPDQCNCWLKIARTALEEK